MNGSLPLRRNLLSCGDTGILFSGQEVLEVRLEAQCVKSEDDVVNHVGALVHRLTCPITSYDQPELVRPLRERFTAQ